MKTRILIGLCMTTREKAHRHIRRQLRLPDYYGANLDALHDCLTDLHTPTEIRVIFADYMRRRLGDYGIRLISLLIAATGENPVLTVCVRKRF